MLSYFISSMLIINSILYHTIMIPPDDRGLQPLLVAEGVVAALVRDDLSLSLSLSLSLYICMYIYIYIYTYIYIYCCTYAYMYIYI